MTAPVDCRRRFTLRVRRENSKARRFGVCFAAWRKLNCRF